MNTTNTAGLPLGFSDPRAELEATRAMVSAVELGKVAPWLGLLSLFARKLKVRMRDLMSDE